MVPRPRPERLPLSYAQQRLWFIDQLEGGVSPPIYHIPAALRLRGELDRSALERAVDTIVTRHESLRTRFGQVEGQLVQIIVAEVRIVVPVEDLSALAPPARQRALSVALRQEWQQSFDLAQVPLLRFRLLQFGPQEHVLLRTFHHIVSDGWSLGVFDQEFATLYEAFREGSDNPLEPLRVQYADFVLWQRGWLDLATWTTGPRTGNQTACGYSAAISLADGPTPPRPTELCGRGVRAELVGDAGDWA